MTERDRAPCPMCGADSDDQARISALRDTLLDPQLGPVWWIDRFGATGLAAACTSKTVNELLSAFDELHRHLVRHSAADQIEQRDQIRLLLDALFDRCTDPEVLKESVRLLNTLLAGLGVAPKARGQALTAIGRESWQDPTSAPQ